MEFCWQCWAKFFGKLVFAMGLILEEVCHFWLNFMRIYSNLCPPHPHSPHAGNLLRMSYTEQRLRGVSENPCSNNSARRLTLFTQMSLISSFPTHFQPHRYFLQKIPSKGKKFNSHLINSLISPEEREGIYSVSLEDGLSVFADDPSMSAKEKYGVPCPSDVPRELIGWGYRHDRCNKY